MIPADAGWAAIAAGMWVAGLGSGVACACVKRVTGSRSEDPTLDGPEADKAIRKALRSRSGTLAATVANVGK